MLKYLKRTARYNQETCDLKAMNKSAKQDLTSLPPKRKDDN